MTQKHSQSQLSNIMAAARNAYVRNGLFYVISAGVKIIYSSVTDPVWVWYYKQTRSSKTFSYQGNSYHYFCSKYGRTWNTERAVEIPIAIKMLEESKGKRILEVGNVLSHHVSVDHKILDKYEVGGGVLNQDVVDFRSDEKFDLIISLSTLEHVGWDETPKDPNKILRAIDNLKSLAKPKGKILITLPLDYNPNVDRLLANESLRFTNQGYLKRISLDNKWKEVDWDEVKNAKTQQSPYTATGIVIGIIE